MSSFSKNVKRELCSIDGKLKSCCGYSLLYGMLFPAQREGNICSIKVLQEDIGEYFLHICMQLSLKSSLEYGYDNKKIHISSGFLRYSSIEEIKKNVIKCGRCKEHFLKGLFLACGGVNNPENSYRLELKFNDKDKADEAFAMLEELGVQPLIADRGEKHVVYLRRSEGIEDFFANIGATSLAFDIMNSKINKELINNANRITNCDSGNINKSIRATNKYLGIINELQSSGDIEKLPPQLKEMAEMRFKHKELSFNELGKLFLPPISKSGVYHRLEKIVDFYEDIKNKE